MFLNRILPYLVFSFIIFSWPFFGYPLTDMDISHWVKVAKEVAFTGKMFTGINDQAHGPLLSWGAGFCVFLFGRSFYSYALFNILIGVLGVGYAYWVSWKLWQDERIASLAAFLSCTSLVTVYLSHTPMYDWVAAVFLFIGFGQYLLYLSQKGHCWMAFLFVAIGTLSRFSIVLGIFGIFMLLTVWIGKRRFWAVFAEGLGLLFVVALVNLPWWIGQYLTHGIDFVGTFLFDNFGRYIHEAPGAPVQKDYYGFLLYVLLGLFPFTGGFLVMLFQTKWKNLFRFEKETLYLMAMWVPCLLLFSFSGHVKLARYIAYVFFPLFIMFAKHLITYHLEDPSFFRALKWVNGLVLSLIGLFLGIMSVQFWPEVQAAPFVAMGVVVLVLGLLVVSMLFWRSIQDVILRPTLYLMLFGGVYMLFFSTLGYLAQTAPYLLEVKMVILQYM